MVHAMMRRLHSFPRRTFALCAAQALALGCSFPGPARVQTTETPNLARGGQIEAAPEFTDPSSAANTRLAHNPLPQIRWQRSLDDALALQKAENRPLLVAINLDGESASDRIVTERYRSPDFVASTERFVCVVASPSRHNARDWNEEGVRIPCPRLGEITCGEHIALEPVLFDTYLGGDRVSPRHALIQVDGTKSFDLFLLFDLRELDKKVAEFGTQVPAVRVPTTALPECGWNRSVELGQADWMRIAQGRDAAIRSVFEALLVDPISPERADHALKAIREKGDSGSFDALRVLLGTAAGRQDATRRAIEDTARAIGATAQLVATARARLTDLGPTPGWPGYGEDRDLLALVARADKDSVATRQFLLMAYVASTAPDRVATAEMRDVREALREAFGQETAAHIEAAVAREGGPIDLVEVLDTARRVGRELAPRARPTKPADVSLEAAEAELAAADEALARAPKDLDAMRRFGRATFACANARRLGGESGVGLLFQDAQHWLAEVARARPDDATAAFDWARAAYWAGDHVAEEAAGMSVLRRLVARDVSSVTPSTHSASRAMRADAALGEMFEAIAWDRLSDPNYVEALRWIGDACALQSAALASGDPVAAAANFARGTWAFATVAASREGNDEDFQTLASFLEANGHTRHELAVLVTGCVRFPDSQLLRDLLNKAFFRASRMDLAASTADWISSRNPASAAAPWYAGYAYILRGEELRRAARAADAVASYSTAIERFAASHVMEPKFVISEFTARAHLGQAHAHLLAGRRQAAADEFVAALRLSPEVGALRDGLEREGVDVVDGVLEWREEGPQVVDALTRFHRGRAVGTEAVDAVKFAAALESAVPDEAHWIAAVADSQLREALRADGRSTKKVRAMVERRGPNGVERVEGDVNEPTEEGDRYMEASIAVARRAHEVANTPESERTLAQSLRVHAERWRLRKSLERARPLFEEAARRAGVLTPANWDEASLADLREQLNAALGDQRPRFRPGR